MMIIKNSNKKSFNLARYNSIMGIIKIKPSENLDEL
jgi:hypothetical protein